MSKREASVGRLIVEGLQELANDLNSNQGAVPPTYRVSTLSLDLTPTRYNAILVRQTRSLLGTTQSVFAQFLGVSVATVRAWEQGSRVPRDAASRLMDEIRHDPEYWRGRLSELARARSTANNPKTIKAS